MLKFDKASAVSLKPRNPPYEKTEGRKSRDTVPLKMVVQHSIVKNSQTLSANAIIHY
jgi:hypothetical protein